jgi:hypothetical protein
VIIPFANSDAVLDECKKPYIVGNNNIPEIKTAIIA